MQRVTRPLAVALISAGTLSFEILLVRVFAIEYFYHFAYMAIGVAMLGLGVSGAAVALMPSISRSTAGRWFTVACGLTVVALVVTPTLVLRISLDPTQLIWDPIQWLRLGALYLLLALPFGLGALATILALTLTPERPGQIYGAGFLGSGVGVACAVGSLWILSPEHVLALPALLASVGLLVAVLGMRDNTKARILASGMVAVTVVLLALPPWYITVSPYKGLPQVEAYPDARRTAGMSSPLGWTVAVEASAFRHAPGLSLAYQGPLPRQTAIFVDGSIAGATSSSESAAESEFYDWLPTALPYSIAQAGQVLIVGSSGDTEIRNALAHGVSRITVVELNPDVMRLALTEESLRAENDRQLEWIVADARSYITRTRRSFDLISLAPAAGFGIVAAGVHGLSEDFLHTTDAYTTYLERVTEQGMLAITRWIRTPPRESIRVILTAVEALRQVRPENVTTGLVIARSWGTVTVLVKPAGFTEQEITQLREWATPRLFDLDWFPGIREPGTVFNQLDEPTLFRAAQAAIGGVDSSARFAAGYSFNVKPVGDAQPYPHHSLRLGSLPTLFGEDRGSWLPFAEWGLIALVATLVQSTLLAGLFILMPVVLFRGALLQRRWFTSVGYFGAIGLAYMAAEIAAIQQLSLLLGHPVYAVAVVLVAVLVFSGVGSTFSDRLNSVITWLFGIVLAVLLAILGLALLPVVHLLQPTPMAVRAGVATLLLAPVALLMGLPFPMGLRRLTSGHRTGIAWAWAANGFASVVAVPLAALIALEIGSPALFFVAAAGYGGAAVLSAVPQGKGLNVE